MVSGPQFLGTRDGPLDATPGYFKDEHGMNPRLQSPATVPFVGLYVRETHGSPPSVFFNLPPTNIDCTIYKIIEPHKSTAFADAHQQHRLCCLEKMREDLEEHIYLDAQQRAATSSMFFITEPHKRDALARRMRATSSRMLHHRVLSSTPSEAQDVRSTRARTLDTTRNHPLHSKQMQHPTINARKHHRKGIDAFSTLAVKHMSTNLSTTLALSAHIRRIIIRYRIEKVQCRNNTAK